MPINMLLVLGTRPQIIKSIPLIKASSGDEEVDISIIHTGQHYDYEMTSSLFNEFDLPPPIANLEVGSHPHIKQLALIMSRLDEALKEDPDIMVVPGDTNSALAAALVASKRGIPLAHMEAGARSYDMKMKEEVNRRIIDHCSDLLFAPTVNCRKNLLDEKVRGDVFRTGDTMLDMFYEIKEKVDECNIVEEMGLEDGEYTLLTLHRPENVDDPKKLALRLDELKHQGKVIFPVHPRTRERLRKYGIKLPSNIKAIKPVNYVEVLKLVKHSKGVATDSGGLQKEVFWSGKPLMILRETTEWPETKTGCIEDFGFGNASQIILGLINSHSNTDNI